MACWPKIVSYPGLVPSSFLKDFCLLSDCPLYISSVQSFSHVHSLLYHGVQHARPPCPSPTPRPWTHVYQVDDATQQFRLLSSPLPPAFNLSYHQGLLKLVCSTHQLAKIIEVQLQHRSFQWIFKTDFFNMDWLDLLAVQGTLKSLVKHTVQKHQFFGAQLSLWSNSHIHSRLLEKP